MEIKKGQVWECLFDYKVWKKGKQYISIKDNFLQDDLSDNVQVTNSSFIREYFKLVEEEEGYKELNDKLEYELDWEFIKQVAERMSTNKGKYSAYNWKKSMDVEKLKQSLFRHVIEVMNGNYQDEEREYGHLEALVCNAMFINYQLKK
jgi:hypothetical protein